MAVQLFTSLNAYYEAIQCLHLTVEHGHLWMPFPSLVDNLTTDDLTCFLTTQGITKEEANNAYEYTYWWLTTAATTQPSQDGEIQLLLDQVNLAILEAGGRTPHANSKKWWQPQFLRPDQVLACMLPVAQSATITEQYGSGPSPTLLGTSPNSTLLMLGPLKLASINRSLQTLSHWATPVLSLQLHCLPVVW